MAGYPESVGGWGAGAIFKEAGRLLKKYISLFHPFVFAFLLPAVIFQILQIFGFAFVISHLPFIPPPPPPHPPHPVHSHWFPGTHRFFTETFASADVSKPPPPPPPGPPIFIALLLLGIGIVMWVLLSLALAGIAKAVEYIYSQNEGEPSVVKGIFKSLPQALFRLFITALWVALFSIILALAISLPLQLLAFLFKHHKPWIFGTLIRIFLTIGLLVLGFILFLTQEIAILEPTNYGLRALKKSSKLVKAKSTPVLVIFVVTILVSELLSKLSELAVIGPAVGKVPFWSIYIFGILLAILYLTYYTYVIVLVVVLYFSCKARHEAEEEGLPEFRHSSTDNPYSPLVVPAEQ